MNQNGYIALMSVIIISTFMIGTVSSLAATIAIQSGDGLSREMKIESEQVAKACSEIARVKILSGNLPRASDFIFESGQCRIVSVTQLGIHIVIRVEGRALSARTNLEVEIQKESGKILSVKEVSHF